MLVSIGFRHGRRLGIEFKASDAPDMTKSLHIALNDLKLERAWIVYPGRELYRVHERVDAIPLDLFLREWATADRP